MSPKLYCEIIIIFIISCSKTEGLPNACREGSKCVPKCCTENFYVSNNSCVENINTSNVFNFTEVLVYDENLKSTGKNLIEVFMFIKTKALYEEELILDDVYVRPYLLENGKLHVAFVIPNVAPASKLFESEEFCADYIEIYEKVYAFGFRTIRREGQADPYKTQLNSIASIISSVFLVLVLIVYSVFGSLRNLVGQIVMSLAASMLGGYTTFAVLVLADPIVYYWRAEFCIGMNFCFYYFYLATFFWANVFSYDIWKQFRSKRLRPYKEVRGEYRRLFIGYSIYAWTIPLAMAVIVICIDLDHIDVTSMPWFIKPNILINRCFFGPTERMYYFYIPMLILLCSNWIFFSMTAFSIWMTMRATQNMGIRSTPTYRIKQRLIIFLKLSLVTGMSWVLEVVSAYLPNSPILFIADLYNVFVGVAIFIFAVCNKRVYKLFMIRFGNRWLLVKKNVQSPSESLTQESLISQDQTNDMQLKLINKPPMNTLS